MYRDIVATALAAALICTAGIAYAGNVNINDADSSARAGARSDADADARSSSAASARQSQSQYQGQAQGQGQTAVGKGGNARSKARGGDAYSEGAYSSTATTTSTATTSDNSNGVTVHGDRVEGSTHLVQGSLTEYRGTNCTVGHGGNVITPFGGAGVTTGVEDEECTKRENIKLVNDLGKHAPTPDLAAEAWNLAWAAAKTLKGISDHDPMAQETLVRPNPRSSVRQSGPSYMNR